MLYHRVTYTIRSIIYNVTYTVSYFNWQLRIGPRANQYKLHAYTDFKWYHCNGSTKFAISASILYNFLVLKFPWIGLNVRFVVLQTVFSAELDELLRN